MDRLEETLDILRVAATKGDSVAVMYSGGKDSLALMDLCIKTFKRVEAVHMYFVPGLEHEQERMDYCKTRWGITPIEIPHWVSFASLRGCAFIDPWPELGLFPDHKLKDLYEFARQITGCDFVAVGAKAADSSWRRRFMKGTAHWDTVINPLKSWNKFDVLAFLQAKGIPIPQQSGSNASGIGLTHKSMKWVSEYHPRDFATIKEYFPYAEVFKAHARFYPDKNAK
jgi:3'-phosphoadenosine 5'-phosphosulfate sulfotransferase (PAPS reductase)/FAD synthetase